MLILKNQNKKVLLKLKQQLLIFFLSEKVGS